MNPTMIGLRRASDASHIVSYNDEDVGKVTSIPKHYGSVNEKQYIAYASDLGDVTHKGMTDFTSPMNRIGVYDAANEAVMAIGWWFFWLDRDTREAEQNEDPDERYVLTPAGKEAINRPDRQGNVADDH